jgi:hypothetical protein
MTLENGESSYSLLLCIKEFRAVFPNFLKFKKLLIKYCVYYLFVENYYLFWSFNLLSA